MSEKMPAQGHVAVNGTARASPLLQKIGLL
jgi:hypothetical protein